MSAQTDQELTKIEDDLRAWLGKLQPAERELMACRLSGFIAAQTALAAGRRTASSLFFELGDQIISTCPEVVP